MEKKVLIYTLTDPRNGYVFYVGRTTMPLERRLSSHWTDRQKKSEKYDAYMNCLRSTNTKPIIEIIDECSYDERRAVEEFWVQIVATWGFLLVNSRHYNTRNYIDPSKTDIIRYKRFSTEESHLLNLLLNGSDNLEISKRVNRTAESIRYAIRYKKPVQESIANQIMQVYLNKASLIINLYNKINKQCQIK